MPARVKLNVSRKAFSQRACQGSERKAREYLHRKVRGVVQKERMRMLNNFDEHPVSREIKGGPTASNISKTLDGYGNLFSFIGFQAGETPIQDLHTFLERNTGRVKYAGYSRRSIKFDISVPSNQEIERVTPMPWAESRSWALGIERGISGLGRFLYDEGRSFSGRSGKGIQVKDQIRKGRFKQVTYLSGIYKGFQEMVRKGVT